MILESYTEGKQTLEDVSELHPRGWKQPSVKCRLRISDRRCVSRRTDDEYDSTVLYALIGMACLYGCFIGYQSAMDLQANLSALAARRCVSPVHRMQWILSETAVSFGLHFFQYDRPSGIYEIHLRLQLESSYAQMLRS